MNKGKDLSEELFKEIIGLPTRIQLGLGSFLTLDFGKELSKEYRTRKGIQTMYFGEWHFWVYMCAWRIDLKGMPIIGSSDDREEIKSRLVDLNQKKLERFTVQNTSFDAILQFESDYELKLFSENVVDSEQWLLYTRENMTFVAGPGAKWRYEKQEE